VEAVAKAYFMHYGVWLSISQIKAILHAAHVPELLEALGWYGDEETYELPPITNRHHGIPCEKPIDDDKGAKARAVLERVGVRV
jgi:hypothetical protein